MIDNVKHMSRLMGQEKSLGTSGGRMKNGRSGEIKGRTGLGRSEQGLYIGAEGNWEADCETLVFFGFMLCGYTFSNVDYFLCFVSI